MPIHNSSNWPLGVLPSQVGRLTLPSGREVFNTGRVLIGLRHDGRPGLDKPVPQSELFAQAVLLDTPAR
jgi:hypothetical protein